MKYYTLLLILFFSCSTQKKLEKINKKEPEAIANFCTTNFPCIVYKVDTIIKYDTTFTEMRWDWDSIPTDTIWLSNSRTQLIDRPVVIASKNVVKYITKTIKDSAEITIYKIKLKDCMDIAVVDQKQIDKLNKKVEKKNKWIMFLLIALLCSIIINLLLYKK